MKIASLSEIAMNERKTWGNCRPGQIAFKSKKTYNRKNKSWMKDYK